VLVDIDLGEESGFDVARRLAEDAAGARARVILISTYAESDFADLVAESPAVGFLSKSDLSRQAIDGLLRGSADPDGRGRS
jgi:DNA-binding NarL/FixJ family response regulator